MKVLIKEKLSPHKSKTPEGYLICRDAVLARTGEQDYYASEIYPDWTGEDKIIKVVRKPEQVFAPETLASFENKPLCVEHPDEDVNPENYNGYAVGFARDIRKGKDADGNDVMLGNLIITDSDTINDIENGIRTELSCGYNCDITSGDHPEQINIRGNHIALCEQGRAGNAKIIDSAPAKYVSGAAGYIKQIEDLAFDAKNRVQHAKNRDLELTNIYATLDTLVHNSRGDRQSVAVAMANGVIDDLKKAFELEGKGLTPFKVGDSAPKKKLPDSDRRIIQRYLNKVSGFTGRDLFIEDIINPLEQFTDYEFIRESIDGWYKIDDGLMRKDYVFYPEGFEDTKFMISLYALADTYKVNEVNGYFLDSIKTKDKSDPKYKGGTVYVIERGLDDFLTKGNKFFDYKAGGIVQDISHFLQTYRCFSTPALAKNFVSNNFPDEELERYKGVLKVKKINYDEFGNISTGNAEKIFDSVHDKLIQSSSKEALKKNIATEIKAGKDPKQAAAIAYSVQRKNDAAPEEFEHYELRVEWGRRQLDRKSGKIADRSAVDITEEMEKPYATRKTYPTLDAAKKRANDIIQRYKYELSDYEDFVITIYGISGRGGWKVDEVSYVREVKDSVEDDFRGEIIDTDELDIEYDYYRGYDIIRNSEGYYIVELDNGPVMVESAEAAQDLIDDFLEKTENMLRDRAIRMKVRDVDYSKEFKKKLVKELAKEKAEVEKEEPEEDMTDERLPIRKAKNNMLRLLREQMKNARRK